MNYCKTAFAVLLGITLTFVFTHIHFTSYAGAFAAFEAETFVWSPGYTVAEINSVAILNVHTNYTLKIANAGLTDSASELVSNFIITFSNVQVVGVSEFKRNIIGTNHSVVLDANNKFIVVLPGKNTC